MRPQRQLILWDGECGFCKRSVAWALRHDHAGRLEAVPYQEAAWPPMDAALYRACADAVHVIRRDGTSLRGGRACLFVLEEVGWRRIARVLALPPLVWGVELAYFIVARNRRLFSRLVWRG